MYMYIYILTVQDMSWLRNHLDPPIHSHGPRWWNRVPRPPVEATRPEAWKVQGKVYQSRYITT